MASYLKGHVNVSREEDSSYEREREREKEKEKSKNRELDKKKSSDKRKYAQKMVANASSEEDDYNFLSDEGEMEKETITTHLKNN